MKSVHLDCFSGISGDMMLGALIDVGIPLAELQAAIDSLTLPDCRLEQEEVHRKGFRATKVHVRYEPEHTHRHLHHITGLIESSQLTETQKDLAKRIFTRLGESEAHVHGTTVQKVHFHEVGAVDSIADIVGVSVGLDRLAADRITCSPIPTGHGSVRIAHGLTSIPAPATAELLKGVPLAPATVAAELTTPTGAAIVATVAEQFGPLPPMTIERIGCGAGDRDFDQQANILRLFIGETTIAVTSDQVLVLETNLDDIAGELVAHCAEQLLAAGALDAYTTPIQMKKNRPAVTLTVLCDPPSRNTLESIIFRETSTLGIRRHLADRTILPRESCRVVTPWGEITGKVGLLPGGERRFAPEYESCRRVAMEKHVSLGEVYEAARRAWPGAE